MESFAQDVIVGLIYSFALKLHVITCAILIINIILLCILIYCLFFTTKKSYLLMASMITDLISNVTLICNYGLLLLSIKLYLKVFIVCKTFLFIVITVFGMTATSFSVLITDRYCILYSHAKLLCPIHKRGIMALFQVTICIVSFLMLVLEMVIKQIRNHKLLNHQGTDYTVMYEYDTLNLFSPLLHYILPTVIIIIFYKQLFGSLRNFIRSMPHPMYYTEKESISDIKDCIIQLLALSAVNTVNIFPFFAVTYINRIVSNMRLQAKEEWVVTIILGLQLSAIMVNIITFKSSVIFTSK